MSDRPWFLYMIRCADGSLYTGISTDVERRFAEHCSGRAPGARYLRGRGPLEMVFRCAAGDRAMASRLEYRVKRMTVAEKRRLVSGRSDIRECLQEVDSSEQ